jgi:hypothetical protein
MMNNRDIVRPKTRLGKRQAALLRELRYSSRDKTNRTVEERGIVPSTSPSSENNMRQSLTYTDGQEWGYLTTTTEHAAYPVLVLGGNVYGPADIVTGLPNADIFGDTDAASLVATWATDSRTDEERSAANQFCSQWPEGPQVRGVIVT